MGSALDRLNAQGGRAGRAQQALDIQRDNNEQMMQYRNDALGQNQSQFDATQQQQQRQFDATLQQNASQFGSKLKQDYQLNTAPASYLNQQKPTFGSGATTPQLGMAPGIAPSSPSPVSSVSAPQTAAAPTVGIGFKPSEDPNRPALRKRGGVVGNVKEDRGTDTEPVLARPGEYFLNPETVAFIGGGDYNAGLKALDNLVRTATGNEPGKSKEGGFKAGGANMGGGQSAGRFRREGMIEGPGTGTSDSIKAQVPKGSYIMPADSTQKIGGDTLGKLGTPVQANVSNGEYQLPPEQVHAVGVQALNQMRDATHAPAGAQGFKPQEGELYFADGGAVESTDELIARISGKYGTGTTPASAQQQAPTSIQQPVKRPTPAPSIGSAADALRGRRRQIEEAGSYADGGSPSEDERRKAAAAGLGPSPTNGALAIGEANRVERMGGRGMYSQANADMARQAASGLDQAFPNTATAFKGASQNIVDAYQAGGLPAAAGATARNTFVPAVGFAADVYRGARMVTDPIANAAKTFITGDPTPIGQEPAKPAAKSGAAPSAKKASPSAGAPAAAPAPAASPQEQAAQPAGFNPASLSQGQRNAAGDAYREAWQRESPGGMMNAGKNAIDLYNAEQTVRGSNITARRGANGVMEFSGNGEGALPQPFTQGVDFGRSREEVRIPISSLNAITQAQAAQIAASENARTARLRDMYEAETDPAKKEQIAKTMAVYSGRSTEAPNRFTVVPGGQEIDPKSGMLITRPSMVINNQTGDQVDMSPRPKTPAITMDRVRETAKARGMTEDQVIELLRQNGYQVG